MDDIGPCEERLLSNRDDLGVLPADIENGSTIRNTVAGTLGMGLDLSDGLLGEKLLCQMPPVARRDNP